MFIARHDIDWESADLISQIAAEERLFGLSLRSLAQRPGNISEMFSGSLKTVGLQAAVDPTAPQMHLWLTRAVRAACASVELIRPGDTPVEVDLGLGQAVHIERLGRNRIFNAQDLKWALFAAMICRDRAAIDLLCRVDPGELRPPGSLMDDYGYTFVRFLQAMLNRRTDAGELLVRAMAETDPEGLRTSAVDFTLYIAVGEIDCFAGLAEPFAAEFDDKLAVALQRHRRYYESVQVTPGRSQRRDPRGFIALGPLAAAAGVHDMGRQIEVRSDYLPGALLDGRFAGGST